jgi:hypothetical protein
MMHYFNFLDWIWSCAHAHIIKHLHYNMPKALRLKHIQHILLLKINNNVAYLM